MLCPFCGAELREQIINPDTSCPVQVVQCTACRRVFALEKDLQEGRLTIQEIFDYDSYISPSVDRVRKTTL